MALDFHGEYRIPAPAADVWAALNDPGVLQGCIAGCRTFERVTDTEFAATVQAKVGPVSALFKGSVVLSELDPPRAYTLTGQGQGGAAGFAKMTARVTLDEEGADTLVRYTAKADIGGKLANVGGRLVQAVGKKNADDFFSAFARSLGGSGVPEMPPAPVVPATAAGGPAVQARAGVRALAHGLFAARSVPLWWIAAAAVLGGIVGFLLGRLG